MTPHLPTPKPVRAAVAAAACAALLALAGCGGGDAGGALPPDAATAGAEPADAVEQRVFTLWADGEAAALQAEQRALLPEAGDDMLHLVVRLNPAAVFTSQRATVLAVRSTGVSQTPQTPQAPEVAPGDAAALRAGQLAAQVQAVDRATQAVLAQSVLQAAPGAVLRQQFAHAVEAFVVAVPWAQAEAVAAALARNPAVDAVEPDRAVSVEQAAASVRALDARAWGVDRIDQRTRQYDRSFRQTLTGSGVSVYVLDTGINPHNEFGSRLDAGFSSIQDGRGTRDCHGHGTHVAGTAAGATLGVAPDARVVPVRVMGCSGSSVGSSVLAGLDWVAAHGTRPAVVNLSLGGAASSTLDAAAQRLMAAGFSVVAAAGNNNVDACTQSPGRADGVITVAASDQADVRAGFSNWGRCVALWAPGTAIGSAGHAAPNAVVTMSGTSMAAPHAAGAVALLLQDSPDLVPAQVRQQLLGQATAQAISGIGGSMTRSLLFAGQDGGSTQLPATVAVGGITLTTQVPAVGSWKAVAQVLVVDGAGAAVSGARVAVRFSNATTALVCTTAASGRCSVTSAAVSWSRVPQLGVAVASVQAAPRVDSGAGSRSAQVARPAAPVASISALSGSMVRSSPSAVNWTPQFLATVRNEAGALVAGATVQATVQVHAGARVVSQRTLQCQTGTGGQCRLVWNGTALNASHTGAVVQVLNVRRDFLVYSPGAITTARVGRTS